MEITLNRADRDEGLNWISDASGVTPLGVNISTSLVSFVGKSGQDIVTIPRVFNSEDQSMAKMNKNISVNSVISTQ